MRFGAYIMTELARVLRALADPTRVRIAALLHGRRELCVCEIVEALGLPQYTVSRHLRELRAAGLVFAARQGRWMHYGLNPRLARRARAIVDAVCEGARAERAVGVDLQRLRKCLRPREGKTARIACCAPREERS
jgi:ArsR family transcriptional regulator